MSTETESLQTGQQQAPQAWYQRSVPLGVLLIVTGAIGLLSAFELSVDKIRLLRDENAVLSCDLNPFFSCSSVMTYPQSEIFGFPNQFLGIGAFAVPIMLGALLVAGVELPRWFMTGLNIGLLGGVVMVTYLQYASLFEIGAGCPWCMVVWVVTILQFCVVTARSARAGAFGAVLRDSLLARVLSGMPLAIAGLWLFIVAAVVLVQFWTFFSAQL